MKNVLNDFVIYWRHHVHKHKWYCKTRLIELSSALGSGLFCLCACFCALFFLLLTLTRTTQHQLRKRFSSGWFYGTITKRNLEGLANDSEALYQVKYEDGDAEELEADQVLSVLTDPGRKDSLVKALADLKNFCWRGKNPLMNAMNSCFLLTIVLLVFWILRERTPKALL